MPDLTLYSRPGCHLCEDMAVALDPIIRNTGLALRIVNIDGNKALSRRFQNDIPVLSLNGDVICRGQLDIAKLENALAAM